MQAFLKKLAKSTRYTALPHRLEVLEHALHTFSESKYERTADLLVQTYRHTERRITVLEQQIAAFKDRALQRHQTVLSEDEVYEQQRAGALGSKGDPCVPPSIC